VVNNKEHDELEVCNKFARHTKNIHFTTTSQPSFLMSIKSRFTTTDVKAMVRDIRSTLLGQRVANVYDISDKIYLFKFAVPGLSEKVDIFYQFHHFLNTKVTDDAADGIWYKISYYQVCS
jgi:hypothetical protein